MALAHELAITELHGVEHFVIYGIVVCALTVAIKLLWKVK